MASSGIDISNHPDIGGLFHCWNDGPVCLTTTVCPCLTYGIAMNELIPPDFADASSCQSITKFAAQCFFLCPVLPLIGHEKGFTGERLRVLCVWWCCNPCYLCKLRRTSKFIKVFMTNVVEHSKAQAQQPPTSQSVHTDRNNTITAEAIEISVDAAAAPVPYNFTR
jgi:hypothetical protein